VRRREFITLLSGAAMAWPLAAHAQPATMPMIGFMHTASADRFPHLVAAFGKGLKEVGYVEGQNVAIEYRWAEGQYDRLPKFAADLVARQVSVLAATGGDPSGLAAKAASATIPIVFEIDVDAQSRAYRRPPQPSQCKRGSSGPAMTAISIPPSRLCLSEAFMP
jgi:putative ABC transport system substrate-binding protein